MYEAFAWKVKFLSDSEKSSFFLNSTSAPYPDALSALI
jgi:hypothetical protein